MAHDPHKTISHFAHPNHQLLKYNNSSEYTCDGCKTPGSGQSYRCKPCNFDMHEYCGTCPRTLTTFMHPHPLILLVRKQQGARTKDRDCNVCGDSVEGLFYWCKECNFNLHPLCTRLPQSLHHKLHPAHPLTFQAPKKDGYCGVCGGVCDSWRYRCVTCDGVDIHFECVLSVACDDTKSTRQTQGPSTCPLQQQRNIGGYGNGYGGAANGAYPYYYYHNNMYNGANYAYGYAYGHGSGYAACPRPYYNYNHAYVNCQPGYNVVNNNCANYQAQGGGAANGSKPGKAMYRIVSKIAFGVLTNVIFGVAFPGLC